MTTAIIEITADNASRLGVDRGDVGRVALVDGGEIAVRRLGDLSWTIGECLPVGDGRRWLVVADDE